MEINFDKLNDKGVINEIMSLFIKDFTSVDSKYTNYFKCVKDNYIVIYFSGVDHFWKNKSDYKNVTLLETTSYLSIKIYKNGYFNIENNLHLISEKHLVAEPIKLNNFKFYELILLLLTTTNQNN